MMIEYSQHKPLSLSRWIKPSHRTFPEQAIGLAIFLIISLAFELLSRWLIQVSWQTDWALQIFSTHSALTMAVYHPFWIVYHILAACAIWNLWRRNSLRILKLELSLFLFQFFLSVAWSLSFFILQEVLLAMAALLFLCSNTILAAPIYWK